MTDARDEVVERVCRVLAQLARDLDGKAAVAERTDGLRHVATRLSSDAESLRQAATLIRTLMERERNLEGALTVGIEFMNIVFRWLSEGGAREPLPEIIRYRSALLAALERP